MILRNRTLASSGKGIFRGSLAGRHSASADSLAGKVILRIVFSSSRSVAAQKLSARELKSATARFSFVPFYE